LKNTFGGAFERTFFFVHQLVSYPMPFSEILSMAFQNIRSNLLRAILTLLIIALGIMALVGILTAIDAIAFSINDNFSGLGANSFTIERKWGDGRGNRGGRRNKASEPIRFRQAQEFKERFAFPAKVSLSFVATSLAQASHGDRETNPNVQLVGVDENYFDVKSQNIQWGRNFSKTEIDEGQAKVVIGQEVAKKLFDDKPEKALDQIISVGAKRYRVIGIMESKGASQGGGADRVVYAPLMDVKAGYGTDDTEYNPIVAIENSTDLEGAQSEASGLFRQIRGLRPGEPDDFETFASNSLVAIFKDSTSSLRFAAAAIGFMTLLGAAIGLMNIMLVSVTERTREIGIYKALGATQRSVLLQFLTEAIVICQMGGIVGILLGILLGNAMPLLLGGSFIVPWTWILLGVLLCMIVGVVSGFYPALKASRLDPIEALRYE
jgi:putative ABC transport system permease protein